MKNACLAAARFCSAAWIGAAALFVTNGIRIVLHPDIDSATIDRLASIRFPAYYLFGFCLVTASCLASCGLPDSVAKWRRWLIRMLLLGSLAILAYDFLDVFHPLARMIAVPGRPRPPEFQALHRYSEIVNSVHVGLALTAAALLCWPADSMPAAD